MSKKLLAIEIPEELYDEFWGFAGSKDGPWRSNKQTAQDSLESAAKIALREFLDKYKERYANQTSQT